MDDLRSFPGGVCWTNTNVYVCFQINFYFYFLGLKSVMSFICLKSVLGWNLLISLVLFDPIFWCALIQILIYNHVDSKGCPDFIRHFLLKIVLCLLHAWSRIFLVIENKMHEGEYLNRTMYRFQFGMVLGENIWINHIISLMEV